MEGTPNDREETQIADLPQDLMDRIQNDPAFRDELRADPEGALSAYGVEVNPETGDEIKAASGAEALTARVSKGWRTGG